MKPNFNINDVKLAKQERLTDGFIKVDKFSLQLPLFEGGMTPELHREVVNSGNAVGVLLYDPTIQKVALIEQFRIGAYASKNSNPWVIELVAGFVEKGESVEDVAIRETMEEANLNIQKLIPIADYLSSPGGSAQQFFLFCGLCDLSDAGGVFGLKEEGEDIRVHVLPLEEVLSWLKSNQVSNSHTIIGLQWLALNAASL